MIHWPPLQNRLSKSSGVFLQEQNWLTVSSRHENFSISMMYDTLHGKYNSHKFLIIAISMHPVLRDTIFPLFHHIKQSILIFILLILYVMILSLPKLVVL